tara:strand:+ start:1123 stop:1836 length:714 start_codon:yes stop_codon:yes gene_type:complete
MFSINFYYRLKYLINKKSNYRVILSFFLDRLKHPFKKSKKKYLRKLHVEYLKSKKITTDFFSINAYYWKKFIGTLPENFKYLEIGSLEGNSALFIINNFKVKKVVCVDIWEDENFKEEQHKNFNNFRTNINEFSNIVEYFKGTSDNYFLNQEDKFDVIYIDGSHEADQVYKDVKNSWKILNMNGILICDDYFYGNIYKNPDNVPSIAINKFVSEIFKNNSIEILCVNNSQIFLKKIN